MSRYPSDDELALVVVMPHTTALRNNRWEMPVPKPILKPGVFHLQQVQPVSLEQLEAFLRKLSDSELASVCARLVYDLELSPRPAP